MLIFEILVVCYNNNTRSNGTFWPRVVDTRVSRHNQKRKYLSFLAGHNSFLSLDIMKGSDLSLRALSNRERKSPLSLSLTVESSFPTAAQETSPKEPPQQFVSGCNTTQPNALVGAQTIYLEHIQGGEASSSHSVMTLRVLHTLVLVENRLRRWWLQGLVVEYWDLEEEEEEPWRAIHQVCPSRFGRLFILCGCGWTILRQTGHG